MFVQITKVTRKVRKNGMTRLKFEWSTCIKRLVINRLALGIALNKIVLAKTFIRKIISSIVQSSSTLEVSQSTDKASYKR